MARLQGFFDESGMHQDATITTVAGFIATENQWNSFNPKWKRALEKQKIKVFHMVDFEKGSRSRGATAQTERTYLEHEQKTRPAGNRLIALNSSC